MYYLIESSPNGLSVVSEFITKEEAVNKSVEMHNNYCDYFITKLEHNTPFGYSVKTGGLQNTGTKLNK